MVEIFQPSTRKKTCVRKNFRNVKMLFLPFIYTISLTKMKLICARDPTFNKNMVQQVIVQFSTTLRNGFNSDVYLYLTFFFW